MATVVRMLDMIIKVMTTHSIDPDLQVAQVNVCAICSHFEHITETCPMFSFADQELANYMDQNSDPPPQVGKPKLEPKTNNLEDAMI